MFFEFGSTIKESSILPTTKGVLKAGYLTCDELANIAPSQGFSESTVEA